MGCFGYICKGCGTPINGSCFTGGEKCLLIHVRHGQELGRVEGHYDEYGRVVEQENLPEEMKYRGDNSGINGHSEICKSEFNFEDSFFKVNGMRVYNGKEVSYTDYLFIMLRENPGGGDEYEEQFAALPRVERSIYSGTVAWHSLCYRKASDESRADLTPSELDPNQSWGRIRKKYC